MNNSQAYTDRPQPTPRWYTNEQFPLLPIFTPKPANEHNTASFYFSWLGLRLWAMDSPSFEIALVANTHWGVGLIGQLPYLRWVACIPCPRKLGEWSMRYLWRKVARAAIQAHIGY